MTAIVTQQLKIVAYVTNPPVRLTTFAVEVLRSEGGSAPPAEGTYTVQYVIMG